MTDNVQSDAAPTPTPSKGSDRYVSRRGRRIVAAIIVILLLSMIGVTALLISYIAPNSGVATKEEANGIQWVRSIYGWGTTPQTQFISPRRVNFTNNGDILVTEPSQRNVMEFSPTGRLVRTFMGSSSTTAAPFGYVGVTQGLEGAIYATEPEMDRVHVVSAADANLGSFIVPQPSDIDYRDGTLVVGSKSGFAIIDPNTGKPIKLVGNFGHGPNEFDTVTGVTVGANNVIYVVDAYNNRLSAYQKDGKRLWMVQTGAPGNKSNVTGQQAQAASQESSAPAKLSVPADVCTDGNGRVVVIDGFDMSIAVFNPSNGQFIAKYGQQGSADGQLMYPSSIAYDPARDWFAIADNGNSRVQIVRLPGSGAVNPLAAARRSIAGPLRACLFPLILLLIAIVVFVVSRRRRKRGSGAKKGTTAAVAENSGDSVEPESNVGSEFADSVQGTEDGSE